MKLSFAEYILFIIGTLAAVVTFLHRLRLTVRKRISKKAYKRGHYAVAFLLAGMLEVLFCMMVRNGVVSIGLNENGIMMLMLISGGTLLIGICNMISYYATTSGER